MQIRVSQQRKCSAARTAVQKATVTPKYNDQLYTLTSREEWWIVLGMYPFIAGKEIARLLPGHVTVFASALRFYTSSPVMFFGPGRGVGTQVRALSAQCVITNSPK